MIDFLDLLSPIFSAGVLGFMLGRMFEKLVRKLDREEKNSERFNKGPS